MFLIFILPAILMTFFICCVFVKSLAVPSILKIFLCLFFCFCSLGLLGANLFAPDLPTPYIKAMLFLFGFSIIFSLLLFSAWVILLFRYRAMQFFPKLKQYNWELTISRIYCVLFLVALLGSFVGFHNAKLPPIVKNETFYIPNLPKSADGTRIAFLADLHIDDIFTDRKRIEDLVKQTNELSPDLIIIGGDIVDGTVDERKDAVLPLQDLKARFGVIATVGNHEYFYSYHEWIKFLPNLGINLLLNEELLLPNGLRIVGVTDPAASGALPKPDPQKFLQQPDVKNGKDAGALLLVSHQPIIADSLCSSSQAKEKTWPSILQLSGHTHGGMVPILKTIVTIINNGYLSGRYSCPGLQLYVSNGTFLWSAFPFRLFCHNGISLITLKSA